MKANRPNARISAPRPVAPVAYATGLVLQELPPGAGAAAGTAVSGMPAPTTPSAGVAEGTAATAGIEDETPTPLGSATYGNRSLNCWLLASTRSPVASAST